MSNEAMVQEMASHRAKASALVLQYNDLIQNKKLDEIGKVETDLNNEIGEYNAISRKMVYGDCLAAEDPMMAAVQTLCYPVLHLKHGKVEGSTTLDRFEIEERTKPINLLELNRQQQIGHDPQWVFKAEKFNMLLTAQKAVELGIDPTGIADNYAMRDISKQMEFGKTPTSKTNILRTLGAVITAMVGEEFKPTSHDVAFLLSVYAKKSRKALTVTCSNHKALVAILMEICHRIINSKGYAVEYKAKADNR